ncbi:hypothetical protein RZS08_25445, partial [Arthrospira platensis SPKY1]|nr:hypothetical protein [Arthrospira platensis SPKY1]
MQEPDRWATQAVFWEKVAETVGHSPAVFAYDLMNEPVLGDTSTWTPGAAFGGFHFVQNLTRTPNGRSFTEIIEEWSQLMISAIRMHDTITPITIGLIACGEIKTWSTDLDFISIHAYPRPDSLPPGFCSMRLSDLIY